jgi:DNA-binding NarL/FixJ family response regulator
MPDKRISVLLIEDNPGDRRLIEASLNQGDEAVFDLMAVDRLATALKRLSAGGVDVVLLDLGLPDSLGLDSFTTLHERAPDIPVVVLSGLDHQGVAAEAVRAGAHHYIVKSRLVDERLDRIILNALEREQVKAALDEEGEPDESVQPTAEWRRESLCAEIAKGDESDRSYPADATLYSLAGDYRELALRYVQSMRRSSDRPVDDVRTMAERLARIGAGGHQVVALHQRSLRDIQPDVTDWHFVEDARVLLVDVLTKLSTAYASPD